MNEAATLNANLTLNCSKKFVHWKTCYISKRSAFPNTQHTNRLEYLKASNKTGNKTIKKNQFTAFV